MTKRLGERRVEVLLGTTARRPARCAGGRVGRRGHRPRQPRRRRGGRARSTRAGCRRSRRTSRARCRRSRRWSCHLGLVGEVPDLPHEVVLHGDPTLVRAHQRHRPRRRRAPGRVLGRGRLVGGHRWSRWPGAGSTSASRSRCASTGRRATRSRSWPGRPYGVLWQGRATIDRKLGTSTPLRGRVRRGRARRGRARAAVRRAGRRRRRRADRPGRAHRRRRPQAGPVARRPA